MSATTVTDDDPVITRCSYGVRHVGFLANPRAPLPRCGECNLSLIVIACGLCRVRLLHCAHCCSDGIPRGFVRITPLPDTFGDL